MAHFEKPSWAPAPDYVVDSKICKGSISKVKIPLGKRRSVALACGDGLWVKASDSKVVGADLQEQKLGSYRVFNLLGKTPGKAQLSTGMGDGTWVTIDVEVVGSAPAKAAAATSGPNFVISDEGNRHLGKYTETGQLWRVELAQGSMITVTLKAGAALKISSNNPAVAEIVGETVAANSRIVVIKGAKTGNAMIEARDAGGSAVVFFQIEIQDPEPDFGLIAQGPVALKRVAEIIKTTAAMPNPAPYPGPYGEVNLKKGMAWGQYLIVYTDHQITIYTSGEKLYRVRTADFVRNVWLDAMADGANRAKGMVILAQYEMALIQGFMVGPGAAIIGKAAILALWIGAHPKESKQAMDGLKKTVAILAEVRRRYPTLWIKLRNALAQKAWQSVPEALEENLQHGDTIAFFVGRILKGLKEAPSIAFSTFVKVLVKTAAIIAALHLPGNIVNVQMQAAKDLAAQLQKEFGKPDLGQPLVPAEANRMAEELLKHADSKQKLDELTRSINDWVPVLETLFKDMQSNRHI